MGWRLHRRLCRRDEWLSFVFAHRWRIRRAAAAFDCRLVEAKSVMTHFVMIGAVEAADFGPERGNLSYARRKYETV